MRVYEGGWPALLLRFAAFSIAYLLLLLLIAGLVAFYATFAA